MVLASPDPATVDAFAANMLRDVASTYGAMHCVRGDRLRLSRDRGTHRPAHRSTTRASPSA